MDMKLSNGFSELDSLEMMEVEGGDVADALMAGGAGVMTTLGLCSVASGSSVAAIATMSVGALAACGPAGWVVLGIAVAGGAVTGAVAYNKLND